MFSSRLFERFNIKFKQNNHTLYSREAYLCQAAPALEMSFALRKLFNIPPGQGRILNADESMMYRYSSANKSWTI